jgi:hypothetical protein
VGGGQVEQGELVLGGHAGHVGQDGPEPPVGGMAGAQVAVEQLWQGRLERFEVHRSTSLWLPRGKFRLRSLGFRICFV